MFENDIGKGEQSQVPLGDVEASFGRDFISEIWSSRRVIGASIIVGLILGCISGYLLPSIYTSKIQVKAASIEKYDSIFSAFIAKDEMNNAVDTLKRPEIKIVDDIIGHIVNSPTKISALTNGYRQADASASYDFSKVYKVNSITPTRGLEKYFIPGYEIILTLKNKNEIVLLTENLSEELMIRINESSLDEFKSILEKKSDLNDLNFELAQKKHEIDSKNSIENTQNSIDIAKVGGFSKPIVSTQMPMASQIPLQNAVPRYFFGYEMLEEEKKQIAINAKDVTKIPGYSDYITGRNQLAALSNLLTQANLNLVDVQVLPDLKVKNGILTKVAVAIGVTLLSILATLSVLAFRVFQRKLDFWSNG